MNPTNTEITILYKMFVLLLSMLSVLKIYVFSVDLINFMSFFCTSLCLSKINYDISASINTSQALIS